MAIPKLNFSTGKVVDPTIGTMQGLESARGALTDMMKQGLAEEELAKQETRQKMLDDRQKILDDRASKEYDYKLTERAKAEAEAKQKQSYLNALSSPGDMFESKAVQEKLMSPGAVAQMVANNPVLTKANEQGIESLTPQEKVQYENHFKQMERLGAMPTKKMEILDAADLYGVLGGEYATTQAVEAKKALELARNTGLADVNKQRTTLELERLKALQATGKADTKDKTMYNTPVQKRDEVMSKSQTYLEKAYAQDSKNGKLADPVKKLNQHMASLGYDGTQIAKAVEEYYKPTKEPWYQFWDSEDNFVVPPDKSITDLVGPPANVATSTGYNVSDRAYDKQVAEISKKYLDEAQSKIENRGVHKPTEELFNRIMNNTYVDESKTTEKIPSREKDIIPKPTKVGGLIGEAINIKGKGGELARLTLENPQQFAKEYELLDPAQQVRVERILQSPASKDVYNRIKEEKLLPKPVYSKDTANTYAAEMQAYGEQQKRLGLEPTSANDSKTKVVTPTLDTKKVPTMQSTIKQIVDKDPSSGMLSSGARMLAGAFGDQSLGNRRVGDKAALNIFDALAQEGVVSRVTSNKDPVEVTSNNIANITELYTNGKDRDIDRGLETVVDHQMRSLPKDNEIRVKYEEAMKDQELASAGAVFISTILLATGMGGEIGAASTRAAVRAKKLADTKNLRSWKNEIRAEKRAKDLLHKSLDRNAVLRSREIGKNLKPKQPVLPEQLQIPRVPSKIPMKAPKQFEFVGKNTSY